jgi:hypothetical protein
VDAGFVVPAPAGQRKLRGNLAGKAAVVGLLNVRQWDARMGIERHVQVVQFSEHGRVPRVVEERRPRAAQEEHTFEPELCHGPVEFGGGRLRVLPWQDGEPAQPGWVGGDRLGQPVVGGLGEVYGLVGRGELGERAVRHDLHLDALLVHVLDPAVADVSSQLEGLRQGHHRRPVVIARPRRGVWGVHQAEVGCLAQNSRPGRVVRRRVDGVFFDADDFHVGLLCV